MGLVALSDAELLGLVLGSVGTANKALEHLHGLAGLKELRQLGDHARLQAAERLEGQRQRFPEQSATARVGALRQALSATQYLHLLAIAGLVGRTTQQTRLRRPVLATTEDAAQWIKASVRARRYPRLAGVGLDSDRRPHRLFFTEGEAEDLTSGLRSYLAECYHWRLERLLLCRLREDSTEFDSTDHQAAEIAQGGCRFFGIALEYLVLDVRDGRIFELTEGRQERMQ